MADTVSDPFVLAYEDNRLQLSRSDDPDINPVYVDFTAGSSAFRRLFGGGRKQAIAKAVGLKKGARPNVVDATAGLGKDAFVLASLGCKVHMIERHEAIAALLEDGIKRAQQNAEIGPWISERLTIQHGDSLSILGGIAPKPDVVYLDPMYPEKKKSALNKKAMQIFKEIIGLDSDAGDLLKLAIPVVGDRVVVKRPAYAEHLGGIKPDTSIKTRSHRFDIYLRSTVRDL